VLVRISARLLKRTLQYTDERAKLEGELLDGVDVVKCMTWEVCSTMSCTMCNIPYGVIRFLCLTPSLLSSQT